MPDGQEIQRTVAVAVRLDAHLLSGLEKGDFVVGSLDFVVEVEEEEDGLGVVLLLLCFHVDLLFLLFLSFLLFFPSGSGDVSVPEGGREDLRGSQLERGP